MVDCYSRFVVVAATRSHTADRIADLIFDRWIKYFGLPARILSDQGPEFESAFFKRLCARIGVKKARTTAYHPQTNSQAERYHRFLTPVLQALVDGHPSRWPDMLPFAMFAYNSHDIAGLGLSPFQIFMGRDPRLPLDLMASADFEFALDHHRYHMWHTRALRDVLEIVRAFQAASNSKNKAAYDARHKPINFAPGDEVMIFRPPNVKGSRKLMPYFRGPFQVLRAVSEVNYEVKGVETGERAVMHVSNLVRYHAPSCKPPAAEPMPTSSASWQSGTPPSQASEAVDEVQSHVAMINTFNPRVWVEHSTVPSAGLGLFARQDFGAGAVICEYRGERLTAEQFVARYPDDDARYAFSTTDGYLDAAGVSHSSAARYVNAVGPNGTPNLRAVEHEGRVFMVAALPVSAGEELFFDYGSTYLWRPSERRDAVGGRRTPPPLEPSVPALLQSSLGGLLPESFQAGEPADEQADEPVEEPEEAPAPTLLAVPPSPAVENPQPTLLAEPPTPEVEKPQPEKEYPPPRTTRLAAFSPEDFVVLTDVDNGTTWVGHVETIDTYHDLLSVKVYGAYNTKADIFARVWRPAYVDPKDDKAVFTSKPLPRYEVWRWTVGPAELCSGPFQLSRSHKIPRSVRVALPSPSANPSS